MAKEDPPKGKNGNATSPANGEALKKLTAEVEQLKATNQQLQTQQGELQSVLVSPQFQEFMKSKNQPVGEFDKSGFAAGRQEVDLETMDRPQLVKHIMDGVVQMIQGTVSPQINKLSTDMIREQLVRGIKDTRGKYSDFDNYATKMSQTSARIEKTGLTAEDILKIASHPGPKKASDGDDGKKPGTQTTEKPGGAGGELKAGDDKETPQETAGRIFDSLKLGDVKA